MILPTLNQDKIDRFRKLREELDGTRLTEDQAKSELTHLVLFWYLAGGHDAYRQRIQQLPIKDANSIRLITSL